MKLHCPILVIYLGNLPSNYRIHQCNLVQLTYIKKIIITFAWFSEIPKFVKLFVMLLLRHFHIGKKASYFTLTTLYNILQLFIKW